MAKNSDALIFTLGIDTSQIFEDLNDATQSLAGRVREANQKLAKNKLIFDAQIDTARAMGDMDAASRLIIAKREQIYKVNQQILKQYADAYNALTDAEKRENNLGGVLEAKIAKQTITLQKAKKALDDYTTKVNTPAKNALGVLKEDAVNMLDIINPAASKALETAESIIAKYRANIGTIATKIKTPTGILGVTAAGVLGAGYGLNSLIDSSIDKATAAAAGAEANARNAAALGMSAKDYGSINTLGKLSGVDITPLINRMSELNRSISTAGVNGNEATKLLEKWGVSLRNSDGTYKAFGNQIKAIAAAYKSAAESGNGFAFGVEVLGNEARKTLPLLRDYDKYSAEAAQLVKNGLADQAKANQLADLKRLYDAQAGQGNGWLGSLGVDAAIASYERQIKIMQARAQWAADNKDALKAIADLTGKWENLIEKVQEAAIKLVGWAAKNPISAAGGATVAGAGVGAAIGSIIPGVGTMLGAIAGGSVGLTGGVLAELLGAEKSKDKAPTTEEKPKETPEENTVNSMLEAQSQAAQKINDALDDQYYRLTHSTQEVELKSLWDAYQKNLADGADPEKAAALYNLQRQQVEDKYTAAAVAEQKKAAEEAAKVEEEAYKKREAAAKEAEQAEKDAANARKTAENEITNIFETDYQKRLREIDEQKNRWIAAAADEAKATEAAEEQKRRARESEAERYLRSQSDLIKKAARLESQGLSGDEVQARLQDYAIKQQYKNLGLTASQIETGGKYMGVLDRIAEYAKSSVLQPITQRLANNNITVNIDSPTVQDNASIDALAEKVAGKINDAIGWEGVGNNGY